MGFLVSPGVEVNEVDLTNVIPAVSTSIGGFAGPFRWGPVEKVITVSSEKDLATIFGKPTAAYSQSFLTAASFLKYATALKVVRAYDATSSTGSKNSADTVARLITDEVTATLNFRFAAKYPGEMGDSLQVVVLTASKSPNINYTQYYNQFDYEISSSDTKEIHILVIDEDGLFTGTAGTVLEKFAGVSYDSAARKADGSTNYCQTIVNSTSQYILIGDTLATDLISNFTSGVNNLVTTIPFISLNENNTPAGITDNMPGLVTGDTTSFQYKISQVTPTVLSALPLTGTAAIDASIATLVSAITNDAVVATAINAGYTFTLNPVDAAKVQTTWTVKFSASAPKEYNRFVRFTAVRPSSTLIPLGASPGAADIALRLAWKIYLIKLKNYYTLFTAFASSTLQQDALIICDAAGASSTGTGVVTAAQRHTIINEYALPASPATGSTVTIVSLNQTTVNNVTTSLLKVDADVLFNADPAIEEVIYNYLDLSSAAGDGIIKISSLTSGADGSGGWLDAEGHVSNALDLLSDPQIVDVNLIFVGAKADIKAGSLSAGEQKLQQLATTRKDCVAFISAPISVGTASSEASKLAYVTAKFSGATATRNSYSVFDSSPLYVYNKYLDNYLWIPACGHIAGLCANTDDVAEPWFSPAGFTRGQLFGVAKLGFNPNQSSRDTIYKLGVNPICAFPGQGTVLYGDKTAQAKPSAFDRINVRRLFIVLEKAIATASKYQLFELNDEFTRAMFRNMVEPFLRDVKGRRGITDFLVVCDETNNTGEVIDTNRFVADIYIKPARSINFITLNFIATRTGVEFSEIAGK